jgi:hypothetical protein
MAPDQRLKSCGQPRIRPASRRIQAADRVIRVQRRHPCTHLSMRWKRARTSLDPQHLPNALVQLQAQYNHCGEAASEKCLSAATFVRSHGRSTLSCLNSRVHPLQRLLDRQLPGDRGLESAATSRDRAADLTGSSTTTMQLRARALLFEMCQRKGL